MTWWWLAAAAVLLVVAWQLSAAARRLDRLHRRVEGAAGALDSMLVRRAHAATSVAVSGLLDPASAVLLNEAADRAVRAGKLANQAVPQSESRLAEYDREREVAESDLSRTLRATLDALPSDHPLVATGELDELADAWFRVRLARRFYNDAVRSALGVRRKRIVRLARLAGTAPLPAMVEIDDEPAIVLGAP